MDSPERSPVVTSKSSSSPVQDSPFFNYLSNLSPIPVKALHGAQGLSELNIPSPVFTSPHINPQRETCFIKRSKCLPSSNVVPSLEHDSREKILTVGSHVSVQPITQSKVRLIPCPHKENDTKASVQVQPHSPSGSVDEYLANTMEVGDCANSTYSADLRVKQGHGVSQAKPSGFIGPKVNITLNDDYATKVTDTEVAASLTSSEKAEKELLGESLFHAKSVDTECEQKDGSKIVNDFVESDLALEPVSGEQPSHHIVADVSAEPFSIVSSNIGHADPNSNEQMPACSGSLCHQGSLDRLQSAEGGQQGILDTPQLPSESLQIIPANENLGETSGAKPNGSVFEEANQHQRGTRRRCLQFEASRAQGNTNCNSLGPWNPTNILLDSRSPASPAEVEIMDSLQLQSRSTSSNRQQVNFSQHITSRLPILPVEMSVAHEVDRSIKNSVNYSVKAPRPSGIGLHLNGIVNTAIMCSTAATSTKCVEKDCLSARKEKSSSVVRHDLLEDSESSLLPMHVVEKFPDNMVVDQQESLAIVRASSATFQSSHDMKLMNDTLQLELLEHHMTPCDERKIALDIADRVEEFSQQYPKMKRKIPSKITESVGCKRCNCKRSKCLKLYCECFAAGIYCAEPCSCQGCFNKPEYEDTVLGTRQQIELRNPLAFAPKIVCRVNESPVQRGEDVIQITPSSARHKRGCNCKKSMCLKKYCECYQAGVGCCGGCRCEGCKNPFGIKEGCRESREMFYRKTDCEKWEETVDDKIDLADIRSDLFQPEHCHPHNLSPLTPLFQTSNHGKDMAKSQVARRYDPSPESVRQEKTGEGTSDLVSYDLESECSTAGRRDPILHRQNELVDICDLTPLPNAPPRASVSSSSSNTGGCQKSSRAKFLHGSVSSSSVAPLCWRGSPVTPLPWLEGNKFSRVPNSDRSRLCEILEDDTPEILKDSRTPIKAVKASSPNQKRVSPPQNHSQEPRSSSSPNVKSGRKFVLRSISMFPPLTPYSDPKGGSNDK